MPMDKCVFQKTCVFAIGTPLNAPSFEIIDSIAFAVASSEAISSPTALARLPPDSLYMCQWNPAIYTSNVSKVFLKFYFNIT